MRTYLDRYNYVRLRIESLLSRVCQKYNKAHDTINKRREDLVLVPLSTWKKYIMESGHILFGQSQRVQSVLANEV